VSKLNVFIRHGPTGIEGHIELDGEMIREDFDRFLTNVNHTFGWLADNDFEPSSRRAGGDGPSAEAAPDVPACPDCGGEMWDNRADKKSARAPDFKCKEKKCDKAIWLTAKPA
jgi:hypothetical protein